MWFTINIRLNERITNIKQSSNYDPVCEQGGELHLTKRKENMKNKYLIELKKFYPATVNIPVTLISNEQTVKVKVI